MTAFQYVLTIVIWGTTWLALKFQLGVAEPEISIFYRFALSASILFLFCKCKKLSLSFTWKEHFFLVLLGFSMFSIHYIFVYKATLHLVSGVVSVVFSSVSLFNILNAYIFFRKKPELQVLTGAYVGLTGLVVFFWKELATFSFKEESLTCLILGVMGAFLFSLSNIVSKRNHKQGMKLIPSTTLGMTYGSLIMLVYIFVFQLPFVLPQNFMYWGSLAYLSLFGSVVAFLCYLNLIAKIGPEKAGYVTVFFPVIAMVLSVFVEDYKLTLYDFVGLAFILVGNYLVLFKKPVSLPVKESQLAD